MRTTQVSVRINRLGNKLTIYADTNVFYEAVAAAFNEAANTLMKTLAGLRATGLGFEDYCKAGDEVDQTLMNDYIARYSEWVTSGEFIAQYTEPSYFKDIDGRVAYRTCATFKKENGHWFYCGLCLPMQTEDTEGLTGYDKWFKEIEDNLSARQDD